MAEKEIYEVYLGPSSRERVEILMDGRARLYRSGQFIIEFVPSPSQLRKIVNNSGTIKITTDKTRRAYYRSKGYFY